MRFLMKFFGWSNYRIVPDNHLGYEVHVRRWWWPFWVQADFTNTFVSVEEAYDFAEHHAKREMTRFKINTSRNS